MNEGGPRVGASVRRRRRALDLTLAGLADRTGLSAPFLSQIENDRARPSMRSLQRIADALDTTAVQLFAAAGGRKAVDVVRAGPPETTEDGDGGVRPLVRGHQRLHALEFTGSHDWDRAFTHRNDEIMYVVAGRAEVEAGGEHHVLEAGDTLYCAGGVAHRWRVLDAGTRVLLVGIAEHIEVSPDA
ncbi:helix-turn-helix domain-containing protein [Actinomadura hibisca]|uniref:helix-turn-helix domain-containing protein n=1 Tax=Actinomadura hibisca TaxID=68565 RepID=UPI00082E343C|nr:XRE family transcriptional regulator [Actinomadura hibisca]